MILTSVFCKTQDPMSELVTDRPDQTESSAVVPHKSLQIETGFVMENNETNLIEQKTFTYSTTLLRYGLLENFELRLGLEYLGEKVLIKNNDTTNTFSGLSPVYTGFKVKVNEEDGWKPEIALLGGIKSPFTANEHFKLSHTAGIIRFALAHTLSDRFSLGYNLGAEWDGESVITRYFYSFALGIAINTNLAMFVESFGLVPEEGDAEHLLDAGLTYLILPNLQMDVSGGIGIHNAPDSFVSFGFSFRLPG